MSIKLWVHKEDHKIDTSLARLTKKKKERTQIKKNWKGNITTNITRNTKKNHKRKLWTVIRQQSGQSRRKRQVSRNLQPVKIESRRNRWFELTDHWKSNGIKKQNETIRTLYKQKFSTRQLHYEILPNPQRRTYTYFSQTIPKDWRGRNSPKFFLWKPPSLWYQYQKKMLQKSKLCGNIFDAYRCKNFQQNISKPNPKIH